MDKKTKTRTNLTVRLSETERDLLSQLQELFGLENESQTLRKLIRDTSTELAVKESDG